MQTSCWLGEGEVMEGVPDLHGSGRRRKREDSFSEPRPLKLPELAGQNVIPDVESIPGASPESHTPGAAGLESELAYEDGDGGGPIESVIAAVEPSVRAPDRPDRGEGCLKGCKCYDPAVICSGRVQLCGVVEYW